MSDKWKITLSSRWFGLLSLIPFSVWVLSPWINPALSWVNSYVSELSVHGQSGASVFKITQLVGGFFLGVYFTFVAKRLSPNSRHRLVAVLLAIAAFSAVLNSLKPMVCSPYLSRACLKLLDSYRFGVDEYLHEGSSIIIWGSILVAEAMMAILSVGRQRFWLWLSLVVQIILNAAIAYQSFNGNHYVGLIQRISLIGFEIWLAYLIIYFSEQSPQSV